MQIRPARSGDRSAIWRIIGPTIRAGETYALDRDMTEPDALAYWLAHDRETFVAEQDGEIVGRSDDGRGVEAMVVRIGGTTNRPDGSTYHITWSLAAGRQARESNAVIAQYGWQPIEPPVPVSLRPDRLSRPNQVG